MPDQCLTKLLVNITHFFCMQNCVTTACYLLKYTSKDDRRLVTEGEWLNDKLITAFLKLLKQQLPHLSGLQDVSLGQTLSFEIEFTEFVQVLHTGSGHWVTVSTIGCAPGEVDIFDSLPPAPTCDLKWQIAALLATPLKCITLR